LFYIRVLEYFIIQWIYPINYLYFRFSWVFTFKNINSNVTFAEPVNKFAHLFLDFDIRCRTKNPLWTLMILKLQHWHVTSNSKHLRQISTWHPLLQLWLVIYFHNSSSPLCVLAHFCPLSLCLLFCYAERLDRHWSERCKPLRWLDLVSKVIWGHNKFLPSPNYEHGTQQWKNCYGQ